MPNVGDVVVYFPRGWALDAAGSPGSVREAEVVGVNEDATLNLRVFLWDSEVFLNNVPESWQPENNPPGTWTEKIVE